MERQVVLRGRLHGRRIDLQDAVDDLERDVEVTLRPLVVKGWTVADMLAVVATFPPGTRTKEDIDRQIVEDRTGWDRG